MSSLVLHFGNDDCHRISILESAGYRVQECASLQQLDSALGTASHVGAIFITERDGPSLSAASAVARAHSAAPLIVFRTSNGSVPEKQFDLVVDCLTAPELWLREIRMLIENRRAALGQTKTQIPPFPPLPPEWPGTRKPPKPDRPSAHAAHSPGRQKN